MSGSTARLQAIAAVTNYKPISAPLNFAETPSAEIFGANTFGTAEMEKREFKTLVDDAKIPAPFHGFHYVGEKKAKTGEQIAVLAYFLYDQDGHDVHEVTLAVPREDAEAGDALVQDFLHHAQFIDAVAPQRQSE